MRESITQEFDYGCGIACYASALNISYEQASQRLGLKQSCSTKFWVKDLTEALNKAGLNYSSKHIKSGSKAPKYADGTIVLIRRSKNYPAGHYLIKHNNTWMDPWINLPFNKDINQAKSGFRKRLPGKVMYSIFPIDSRN